MSLVEDPSQDLDVYSSESSQPSAPASAPAAVEPTLFGQAEGHKPDQFHSTTTKQEKAEQQASIDAEKHRVALKKHVHHSTIDKTPFWIVGGALLFASLVIGN